MSKEYNWKEADWTNKDDFTVAEVFAVEDGKKIPLVTHKASTESPFYYVTQGQRRSVVLNMNKSEVK